MDPESSKQALPFLPPSEPSAAAHIPRPATKRMKEIERTSQYVISCLKGTAIMFLISMGLNALFLVVPEYNTGKIRDSLIVQILLFSKKRTKGRASSPPTSHSETSATTHSSTPAEQPSST